MRKRLGALVGLAVCLGLLAGVLMGLSGCTAKGQQEAEMRARLVQALEFDLVAQRQGENFTATVWLGAGETTERDMTLQFTAPSSVKGLTVSQKNGQIVATLGSLTLKEDAVRQILLLLSPFSLFSYTESAVYRQGEDTVVCYVGEGESITYYLKEGDFPYKILYTLPGESITLYPTLHSEESEGQP